MSRPVTGLPRGRIKGTPLTRRQQDKHRESIETAKLVRRLKDHSLGLIEMSPSQVRAAEILLNKSLPNLSATEIDATVSDERVETMTDAQLIAIAGGKSA